MFYRQIILWPTTNCNLQCKYCYAVVPDKNQSGSILEKKKIISRDIIKRAIDLLRPEGRTVLQISGGEPTLYPELLEFIIDHTRVKRPRASIQLQTNATLISDRIIKLIKKNNISVGVSIDGISDINERLRGKTKQVISGIKKLADNNIMLDITSVITSENVKYMYKIIGLAVLNGNVGSVSFDFLRRSGRAVKKFQNLQADIEDVESGFSRAHRLLKIINSKNNNKISIKDLFLFELRLNSNNMNPYYCYAAMGDSATVTPGGDMFLCPSLVGREEFYWGNVKDIASLNTLAKRSVEDLKDCKSCEIKYICRGGCPARAYLENSDWESISELECSFRRWSYEKYFKVRKDRNELRIDKVC
ncbi:MAG: radical SAM protein [Actinomycetia bacterium]|nr:radical SAM protein [Actinomycetes bacterium]